jgi:putative Mg2+ transporter-C (MgtC) family protein
MIADPTFSEIVMRVLAAFAAGLLVGLERESHGRAAGLRTTTLACVASAVAMILSELLFV